MDHSMRWSHNSQLLYVVAVANIAVAKPCLAEKKLSILRKPRWGLQTRRYAMERDRYERSDTAACYLKTLTISLLRKFSAHL